jgi:hypothetical protein
LQLRELQELQERYDDRLERVRRELVDLADADTELADALDLEAENLMEFIAELDHERWHRADPVASSRS